MENIVPVEEWRIPNKEENVLKAHAKKEHWVLARDTSRSRLGSQLCTKYNSFTTC